MSQIVTEVCDAVERAIGKSDGLVLLHRPYIPASAWDYIKECLDTGWVSSAGSYVSRFEETLAASVGCRRAVATVNGTAALEICFRLMGVTAGDEVIMPALTFVATANAAAHLGAQPHFVDVDTVSLSLCPVALEQHLAKVADVQDGQTINRETGRRIAAVCVMHCFGHPADLDELVAVCSKYGIPLIEDAAESLGSLYKGVHTGRAGAIAAVSFNGNKILTTGGGGAILTDDDALADRAKHITTTAKTPHAWEFHHDEVGWNYRMPNINAALGVAQLEQLEVMLDSKRRLQQRYQDEFASVSGVQLLQEPGYARSNYWLNCMILDESLVDSRDALLEALNAANFQCRPLWQPMHRLPMYRDCPRAGLANTESLVARCINIPSSADLAPGWLEAHA